MSGPERSSTLSVMLHLAEGVWITCHSYKDAGPILSVGDSRVDVTVAPKQRDSISAADVATARDLVAAATTYLRECERLAALSTPPVAA